MKKRAEGKVDAVISREASETAMQFKVRRKKTVAEVRRKMMAGKRVATR